MKQMEQVPVAVGDLDEPSGNLKSEYFPHFIRKISFEVEIHWRCNIRSMFHDISILPVASSLLSLMVRNQLTWCISLTFSVSHKSLPTLRPGVERRLLRDSAQQQFHQNYQWNGGEILSHARERKPQAYGGKKLDFFYTATWHTYNSPCINISTCWDIFFAWTCPFSE